MTSTLIKSLFIAVILGTIFSIVMNILTATYIVKEYVPGTIESQSLLTGIDAVKASIRKFGLISFVQNLIPYFASFFLAILLACFWFKTWDSIEKE